MRFITEFLIISIQLTRERSHKGPSTSTAPPPSSVPSGVGSASALTWAAWPQCLTAWTTTAPPRCSCGCCWAWFLLSVLVPVSSVAAVDVVPGYSHSAVPAVTEIPRRRRWRVLRGETTLDCAILRHFFNLFVVSGFLPWPAPRPPLSPSSWFPKGKTELCDTCII